MWGQGGRLGQLRDTIQRRFYRVWFRGPNRLNDDEAESFSKLCFHGGTLALKYKNATQNPLYAILVGCKFNLWGQARSIGKISQQGEARFGLAQPLTIKSVYQFAPYLGVQWNF